LDAALYDPAPRRTPGQKGRPCLKGARQATLAERLVEPTTAWQTVTVCWYGGSRREVDVVSGTAVWDHSGLAPVPLRWVLIRDPKTERQAVGVGRLRHRLAATSKAQAIAYALAFQASDNTAIQELSAVFGDKSIVTCI
jgi:hypothetical protein